MHGLNPWFVSCSCTSCRVTRTGLCIQKPFPWPDARPDWRLGSDEKSGNGQLNLVKTTQTFPVTDMASGTPQFSLMRISLVTFICTCSPWANGSVQRRSLNTLSHPSSRLGFASSRRSQFTLLSTGWKRWAIKGDVVWWAWVRRCGKLPPECVSATVAGTWNSDPLVEQKPHEHTNRIWSPNASFL